MIREEFVTYSTAELLREKGFNEPCDYQYEVCDPERGAAMYNITDRSRYPQYYIDAPTQAMTMRWLREVHGTHIEIFGAVDTAGKSKRLFYFAIALLSQQHPNLDWVDEDTEYESYEEACEAAIRYCLKNLD